MDMNWGFIKLGGKFSALGFIVGALMAGCGGSGGGAPVAGSSSSPGVASYIADQQSGGFVGSWSRAAAPASAAATVDTLVATGTANIYASTSAEKLLTNGIWGANTNSAWVYYDLVPTGWMVSPSTATLMDTGDGSNVTITPTGEPGWGVGVSQTNLAATAISCGTAACAVPGNYPAGATTYKFSFNSNRYVLISSLSWLPFTDVNGTLLTALPTVGATFCSPTYSMVFQAISTIPAGGANNYNTYYSTSCSAANIATALAGVPIFTALLSTQPTGNTVVPNVLRISGVTGSFTAWNNVIFGLRAGNVWMGMMITAGVTAGSDKNKIAINAELVANGLTALP